MKKKILILIAALSLTVTRGVATHFLFQNSLTFSWLFPDFSPFSRHFQRPSSLTSVLSHQIFQYSTYFQRIKQSCNKRMRPICKFMFPKIKETAIAISVFRKFWNSPDFCQFFPISLTQTKIPWLSLDLEKFSFSRLFSLTVATLSNSFVRNWHFWIIILIGHVKFQTHKFYFSLETPKSEDPDLIRVSIICKQFSHFFSRNI